MKIRDMCMVNAVEMQQHNFHIRLNLSRQQFGIFRIGINAQQPINKFN